jgi:Na+-driven multidrug efflux pump
VRHTRLTLRNFAGYSSVVLTLSLVASGFGAVDLLMVAPHGVQHVAAVGQGDLLTVGLLACFIGVGDAFTSRLAVAEGEGTTARRLPVLAASFLVLVIVCQLIALALVVALEPALTLLGQSKELIPGIVDYVTLRLFGIVPMLVYFAISEALKICGYKGTSSVTLLIGFAANLLLDWAFLNTTLSSSFGSPETAVATASLLAQTLMVVCGGLIFRRRMRARSQRFVRPHRPEVVGELRSMARVAPGVGLRHANDYVGSIVPVLFIGTLGVGPLAAAVVATKVYAMFCRIPQACFAGAFAFYGYALGRSGEDLDALVRKLRLYAAVPTAVATLVVVVVSPWLVAAFGGNGLDRDLAQLLLLAYILYVPAYFFEQFYGELLTVHQRGGVLFAASTVMTYGLTLPLAWYAAFVANSAFLTLACKGLSTALLAGVFWYMLRRHSWATSAVRLV